MEIEQERKAGFYYGYVIVGLIFLILATSMLSVAVFGVFFQPLAEEFHWSRTIISGAMAINNLVFGVFCIVTARLCERFSPRAVISISGVLLGLGYFLMAGTDSVWQLYLSFGVVMAIGMSSFIAALNIITRWFVKRRGLMTGIAFTGTGVSGMIGPPVSNWLILTYDWRQALMVLGAATLVIVVAAALFLRRDPQRAGQLNSGEAATGQDSTVTAGLSMKEALRTSQFWITCLMYFSGLFCSFVFIVHIVVYAIGLGIAPATAADILAVRGLVGIFVTIAIGLVGDRFGNRRTMLVCFSIMAVAYVWVMAIGQVWQFYAFAAILGITFGGVMVLMSPLIAEIFGLRTHGVILAASALAGTAGGALGPLLAGYAFDQTGSYNWAFITCAALSVISGVTMLFLKKRTAQAAPSELS
jgi:MFS family permease